MLGGIKEPKRVISHEKERAIIIFGDDLTFPVLIDESSASIVNHWAYSPLIYRYIHNINMVE